MIFALVLWKENVSVARQAAKAPGAVLFLVGSAMLVCTSLVTWILVLFTRRRGPLIIT